MAIQILNDSLRFTTLLSARSIKTKALLLIVLLMLTRFFISVQGILLLFLITVKYKF